MIGFDLAFVEHLLVLDGAMRDGEKLGICCRVGSWFHGVSYGYHGLGGWQFLRRCLQLNVIDVHGLALRVAMIYGATTDVYHRVLTSIA